MHNISFQSNIIYFYYEFKDDSNENGIICVTVGNTLYITRCSLVNISLYNIIIVHQLYSANSRRGDTMSKM